MHTTGELRRGLSRLTAFALGAGLLVVGGVVTPAAQAQDPAQAPEPGALTAGDSLFPNQGNGGYDALHYDINLAVDVAVSSVNNAVASTSFRPGTKATIRAVTTGAPLSSYAFDFQGSLSTLAASTLNVDSVTVNGAPATFSRIENTTTSNATTDSHKLVVTPATPVDGVFTTVVTYSGVPVRHVDTDGSSEGWNNTTDGATFVNQPVGSMTAFPNNNTPRDKATYTITLDVPTTLTTSNAAQGGNARAAAGVSNGELVSRTPSADGSRTTWVWDQAKPMASELSLISVGRYDMYTSNITLATGRTIPEWSFIDPAISVANQTTTLSTRAQLGSVLDFFETKYGPYPGNSTGLVTDVVPSAINYALETQDRSFFPNSAGRGTTYHEVMHQWWGDSVNPTDWNDIVLNEGPARYSESQYPYEGGGSTTTSTETAIYDLWNNTLATNSAFTTPPAAMTQASQLFGAQVYNKGAMSLEALRTSIGAADFEILMRQYQLTYGGGQITGRRTAAFQAMAESISGRDLTAFFQVWWYTAGKPAWPAKFNLDLGGPTSLTSAGDPVTYSVTSRNTGKVSQTGSIVTVDFSDVLDDATVGALPANTTLDGNTLTWTVPATAVGTTSSVAIPFTVNASTTGNRLRAVARASTLGSTCLACTTTTTVGTAPIAPAPVPTITGGTPTVAAPLSADTTGWAAGTTFAYQWFLDGTPVPGATSATYTPDGSVVGFAVTVKVTGTLDGFLATAATSAATPVGVRATPTSAVPTISGTPQIGLPLTVDPGAWQPGTLFTYTWAANGTTISGATGPTYTPAVAAQAGQTLTATVTGTKFGYTTTARTSAATATVAAGAPLALTPTPTLTGTPKVGTSYVSSPGQWDDGVTLAYTWQANGTTIAGATGIAFTPTATQLGQTLTVTVTGTKTGIASVTKVSQPSAPVDPGTQVLQPTPTITGTPRALTASTGVPGTWDTGTVLTYQWLVDGEAVAGAVTTTYTPTPAQVGQALTFEVTSTRAAYTTVTKASGAKTIVGLAQTLTPTPSISGGTQYPSTLTGDPGEWDPGTTLAYQWLAGGTPIAGATALTHPLTPAEIGQPITFRVTSTKVGYETAVETSAATDAITSGVQTLTPTPTISGTPKVDVELTGAPGTWDNGTALAYEWLADGSPIGGATGLTYTPGSSKLGAVLTFAVTGTKAGYDDVTKSSAPTAPVAAGDLGTTPTPTISGTPKVDLELTGVPGVWESGTTLAYQWLVDGSPVANATGLTYTPRAAKVGSVVTFAVTGTRAGYAPVTKTSAGTAPVAAGDLTLTPKPSVTGTPKVDVELTGVPGTWDDGITLTYAWSADGSPIAGAQGLTYSPTAAQVGAVLTFGVTGAKSGYSSVTQSVDTDAVAAGEQSNTPTPVVSGVAKVGRPLSVTAGEWDAGTALSYQWFVDAMLVAGADSTTFVPPASAVGQRVTARVTGVKAGYVPVTRSSEPTAAVAPGDLTSTPTPAILGAAKVGSIVTASPGEWDEGVALDYQWLADGEAIAGATMSAYVPGAEQLGAVLSVAVTGTKAGYASATRTSGPSEEVAPGDQGATPTPTVSGTSRVGKVLTATTGAWDESTSLTYQWLQDGEAIAGATAATYLLVPDDARTRVSIVVTGARAGYSTMERTSDAVTVALGEQSRKPAPTVKGKAKVGKTLHARPGPHDAGTTLTYRWIVGGDAKASGRTFKIRKAYVGKRIRVRVTARKPGYVSASGLSAKVGPVVGR